MDLARDYSIDETAPMADAIPERPSIDRLPKQPRIDDAPSEITSDVAPAAFRYVLSSGLFGLPVNAQSVDWMLVNNSRSIATVRVTVFRAGAGQKVVVPPGTLVVNVDSGATTHNANHAGAGQPFVPGFYYELVVETNDRRVLPSVHVWQDHGNTVMPGTLISPGSFVEI